MSLCSHDHRAFARAGHIFVVNYGNISALYDGDWARGQIILLLLTHVPTEVRGEARDLY